MSEKTSSSEIKMIKQHTINSQTRGSGNNPTPSTPKPVNVAPPSQKPKDKK
jgi:hypothetical protein